MRIAVIGMGKVGNALGRRWAETGHQVTFCVRDPNDTRKRAEAGKAKAAIGPLGDTAKAEAVLLAVPWSAVPDALKASGDLSGKVLLDCTNPVTPELTHLTIGQSTSAGEGVASLAPQARVVKVFNTNDAKNMGNPDYGGHKVTMLYGRRRGEPGRRRIGRGDRVRANLPGAAQGSPIAGAARDGMDHPRATSWSRP
jgi:predicted dinucleotide-binding enzyme